MLDLKDYECLIQTGTEFRPSGRISLNSKLPPGSYTLAYDQFGNFWFDSITTKTDNIVDLPSPEYQFVVNQMKHFLNPVTKKRFEDYGFLYKRSALLHGMPGTGKTVIVNRIINEVVNKGGIVLFNPHPALLNKAYKALDQLQPNDMTLVVFEELDELIRDSESHLLNLLDGEIQKDNVMYLATTNYIDKIPQRIRRPGRFSNIIEVGFPNEECRRMFIGTKLTDKSEIDSLTKLSEGFTIDELKELILSVKCLDMNPKDVANRISLNSDRFVEEEKNVDEDDDFDEYRPSLLSPVKYKSKGKYA